MKNEQYPHLQKIAALITSKPPRFRHTRTIIKIVAFIGMVAVIVTTVWTYQQSQQHITDQQQATLSRMVASVAEKSNISTQKVWSDFRKKFMVNSYKHLKQGDYNAAIEYFYFVRSNNPIYSK